MAEWQANGNGLTHWRAKLCPPKLCLLSRKHETQLCEAYYGPLVHKVTSLCLASLRVVQAWPLEIRRLFSYCERRCNHCLLTAVFSKNTPFTAFDHRGKQTLCHKKRCRRGCHIKPPAAGACPKVGSSFLPPCAKKQ